MYVYIRTYMECTRVHVLYVCTYVCMYVCMYVRMYVCMHACMYVCMYVCMCTYLIYIYICICHYITDMTLQYNMTSHYISLQAYVAYVHTFLCCLQTSELRAPPHSRPSFLKQWPLSGARAETVRQRWCTGAALKVAAWKGPSKAPSCMD